MMTRARLAILGAVTLVGCGSGAFLNGQPAPGGADIVVVAPAALGYPPQIIHATSLELQGGSFDLHLVKGTAVSALVVDSAGGAIPNAAVRFTLHESGTAISATSDQTGAASVQLAEGFYDVTITPDAIAMPHLPARTASLTVPAGAAPLAPVYTMSPGASIRGTLHNDLGAALTGWTIVARQESGADMSTVDTTGPVGFNVFVTSTGSWLITCTPPQNQTSFPVVTKRIAIPDMAVETAFDFTFPSSAKAINTVSGTVFGDGATDPSLFSGIIVRAKATLSSGDPDVTFGYDQSVQTGANGVFSLVVPSGTYSFLIEPAINFAYSHLVIATLDVTSDTTIPSGLTSLPAEATIGGRITGPTGDGVGGARVLFAAADGSFYQFSKRTDSSGNYSMTVDEGPYSISVMPDPGSGYTRATTTSTIAHDDPAQSFSVPAGFNVSGVVLGVANERVPNATISVLDPITSTEIGSAPAFGDDNANYVITVPAI